MFRHFAKWASTSTAACVAQVEGTGQHIGQQPKLVKNHMHSASVARVAYVAHDNSEKCKAPDPRTEYAALEGHGSQAWTPEDWRAFFDERAGIAEFDGGLSRQQAEARAFECCVQHWQSICPPGLGETDGCPVCLWPLGRGGVPVLRAGGDHIWMHPECVERFNIRSRTEARIEIEKAGIFAPEGWNP